MVGVSVGCLMGCFFCRMKEPRAWAVCEAYNVFQTQFPPSTAKGAISLSKCERFCFFSWGSQRQEGA